MSKGTYNSSGQNDSMFDVKLFDGNGETKDLIRWLGIIFPLSLAIIFSLQEKAELVLIFLTKDDTVQNLWEEARKEVMLIKMNTDTRPYPPIISTSDLAFQ